MEDATKEKPNGSAFPRFGPTGFDVCVWQYGKWMGASSARGRALQYVMIDNQNDSALGLAHFHQASQAFLHEFMGLKDVSIFTSFSLRRSMHTLAEIRRATL